MANRVQRSRARGMTPRAFWTWFQLAAGSFTINGRIRQYVTNRCPICTVVTARTGCEFRNSQYLEAANVVGLDLGFVSLVVAAADGDYERMSDEACAVRDRMQAMIQKARSKPR